MLCGGTAELIRAGFETLVEAGYQPEVAYYECLHELKLIVDLIWEGGLSHMRWSISDTAEYGDFTRGDRVIDDHVRAKMREVLGEIQDGTFAREWIAEMDSGEHKLDELRAAARERQIEQVGSELRSLMTRKQPAGERECRLTFRSPSWATERSDLRLRGSSRKRRRHRAGDRASAPARPRARTGRRQGAGVPASRRRAHDGRSPTSATTRRSRSSPR